MSARRHSSADEIERDIARTRARLAGTVDALAARLAPSHLAREGVTMLREFLDRLDGVKLGGRLRADPVALALIGLGIAWFVAENASRTNSAAQDLDKETPSSGETGPAPRVEKSLFGEGARNHAGGWFHQTVNATGTAFRTVYDRGGAVIGQASELIAHPASSGEKVRHAGNRLLHRIESNPLLLGLAGVAAGAALAMLLPASRSERELAAHAREEMWDTAEKIGHRAAAAMRGMADGSQHDSEGSPLERRIDAD